MIETIKKTRDNFKNNLPQRKEEVHHNTLNKAETKTITPIKYKKDSQNLNSSMDDKAIRKEKGLTENKIKHLTRNVNNNTNTNLTRENSKNRSILNLNNTFNKNSETQRNNNEKNSIKKEVIEKLKKDLEKKTSTVNLKKKSKQALNLSADCEIIETKKVRDRSKLPPSGNKK